VATPFALYFTGLYRLMLTNSALHQLLHVHFLVAGCLFFWPLIGLDPLPGKWPYPARALLMLLSTPFHTILGLTVMQSRSLIGGDYYPSLHLGWANPAADQQVAGGILWAGGELVSVVMLAVLVVQWMRQSDREAARLDRQLDRSRVTRQIGTGQASATEEPEPLWERPWWELERPGVGQRIEAEAAGYDQGASTGGSKPI
jgi:putative copper resistance protein D